MSRGNKAGNSHRTPGTCAANKKARVKFIFIFPFSSHHVIHSLPADPTLHISNSKSRLKILPHSSTLTLSFRNIHPDGLACSKGDGPVGQFKLSEPCEWVGLMQMGQSTTTRVAEVGGLSSGAKMVKTFVKRYLPFSRQMRRFCA